MTTDKTPATLAVDVLAVMDELIDFEERHAEYEPRQNHEAREAHAAVAELLLAAGDADRAFTRSAEHPFLLRIRAAIARVKGESA